MGILKGRVAIVTGSSSGVGRGVALKFAEEGASVVAAARRIEKLKTLVEEIEAKGGTATAVACDIAKEEDIDKVVKTAIEKHGKIDILANIAQGGLETPRFMNETTTEQALLSFKTGPLQTLLFMQKCFPYMKEKHYGRIINCASHSAITGQPGYTAYVMAKGGIMALSRVAAHEWGKFGITTNVFIPVIKTEAFEFSEQGKAACAQLEKIVPVGYFGKPCEDCAPIVAFIASEGAHYLNGQFIGVDGGLTIIA